MSNRTTNLSSIILIVLVIITTSCSNKHFDNEQLICEKSANIKIQELTEQQLDNLELLGKIWGLMKYHHPAIASGKYDWDLELINMLPDYLSASDNTRRDSYLLKWIDYYGEIPSKNAKPTTKEVIMEADNGWIDELEMSVQLNKKLHEIIDNRYQGRQYYVKIPRIRARNPIIMNEYAFKDQKLPSIGVRLISIYRYWNIINYYFPYRYLTDNDWSIVLKKHLPDFVTANNSEEYLKSVNMLVSEINDTHAGSFGFYNLGNYQAPYKLHFIEDQLVVVGYYDDELCDTSTLKIGDVITAINKQPVGNMVDSLSRIVSASNKGSFYRLVTYFALKSYTDFIEIQCHSKDGIVRNFVLRAPLQKEWKNKYFEQALTPMKLTMLTPEIGYVSLSCSDENFNKVIDSIQDLSSVIVDLRDGISLSGNKWNKFSTFISNCNKPTNYVKFSRPNPKTPGEFVKMNGYNTSSGIKKYKGKVILLVNSMVQSHGEFNVMLMKTNPNVTIVGSNTAGADGNVTSFYVPRVTTMFSGIGVYYPDWSETQRIGIVPDVFIEPTIKGVWNNRDEVLEMAIQVLEE